MHLQETLSQSRNPCEGTKKATICFMKQKLFQSFPNIAAGCAEIRASKNMSGTLFFITSPDYPYKTTETLTTVSRKQTGDKLHEKHQRGEDQESKNVLEEKKLKKAKR